MNKELQDLAWRVLPVEFREEVKRLYKAIREKSVNNSSTERYFDGGCEYAFEKLFGKHNLTSDAEGEEMLMVSRKRVQEMYAHYDKICNDPNRPKDYIESVYEHADGVTMALDDLFGSKCLLDNVDSLRNNVDSLSQKSPENCDKENHISTDDNKQAEPKFKVGDIVRFKYCCTPHQIDGFKILNGVILYYVGEVWAEESDLEPYTEPEEVARIKPIESEISVYLATKEEDEEFRLLLHENGFKWNDGESLINSSMWRYYGEGTKIHFIHPDKTVTFCGKKTSNTLAFSKFKKQYFEEPSNAESAVSCPKSVENLRIASEESHLRNLSQETENCDIQLDNILKDSFRNERRLNIATTIMAGVMANPNIIKSRGDLKAISDKWLASRTLELADTCLLYTSPSPRD